jgi:transcriptional regulator NrdR family protein
MMKRTKNKKKSVNGAKCKNCIVKRRGIAEEFDERKIYASCYAACLSSHVPHMKAEKVCEKVSSELKIWANKKGVLSSDDIFAKTTLVLRKHDKDSAFMYETHRDIS